MEVLIVGTGNMARGIGLRLVRGGHTVRIAHRDPDNATDLAEELGADAVGEPLESAAGAEVIVLALPYEDSKELARRWSADLAGKILVDICTRSTTRPSTASSPRPANQRPRRSPKPLPARRSSRRSTPPSRAASRRPAGSTSSSPATTAAPADSSPTCAPTPTSAR